MRYATTLFAVMLLAGCSNGSAQSPADDSNNTFNHEDVSISDLDLAARAAVQGDPEAAAHLHSCQKLKYATLGNLLASRGVNLASTTAGSAGALYNAGTQALGVADYTARVGEAVVPTTAGAT